MSRYVTQVQYGARADLVPSQLIAAMDDEQLAALLAARPDLADPRPSSVTTVQQRAGSWASVSACLARLDVGALQVIQSLSLLPSGTSTWPRPALPTRGRAKRTSGRRRRSTERGWSGDPAGADQDWRKSESLETMRYPCSPA